MSLWLKGPGFKSWYYKAFSENLVFVSGHYFEGMKMAMLPNNYDYYGAEKNLILYLGSILLFLVPS